MKKLSGSFSRSLAILPENEDNITGRPCSRSCLRQECVVCFLAPGVASHHPGKALVQSWQRAFAGILCFCTKQQNQPQTDCPARQRSMGAGPPHRCRARQLNESRLEFPGFTIPPAWPCHAVPPLHKGGFFFAQANTTGPSSHNTHGCSVALGPYRAPPGARKRSGKNLVFPRESAAALPTGMMVISALRRNNTPPTL